MRLEKRNHSSPLALVLAPVGAVVFTLLVSSLLVLWAGAMLLLGSALMKARLGEIGRASCRERV